MAKIILQKMRFDNILSYGEGNEIDFQQGRVVQLVGKNGSGKSSLATILEECLFNKNSKGLAKGDLFNWDLEKKHYHIEVDFSKDGDSYSVIKDVKSTAKVTLICNGEDISGHTATQTYKLISDIFGCDFTTFTKMVYQSVGSSLDFLKSTDAKRKEFLTSLFDQEIYKSTENDVKADIKEVEASVSKLSGSIQSTKKMLEMIIKDSQLDIPERVPVPEYDDNGTNEQISELRVQAALATQQSAMIEKKIEADRRVQAAKDKLDKFNKPIPNVSKEEVDNLQKEHAVLLSQKKEFAGQVREFSTQSAHTHCRTCGSLLDTTAAKHALALAQEKLGEVEKKVIEVEPILEALNADLRYLKDFELSSKSLEEAIAYVKEFEGVDTSLNTDIKDINSQIRTLQTQLQEHKQDVEKAKQINSDSDKKQALKDAALERLDLVQADLEELTENLKEQQELLADLQIIAKSLKDIVGYKLEYNVKVFEELINKYLSELTDGVFALNFELNGAKLDVVIYNNGRQTSMASCSTGQQQRIQTATLLAIRSLLSAISKVDINLLFLDEVISYIDTQGIETLIEVLLGEQDLNSFIVSHGHSHPLAEQINIVQDAKQVSRLEVSK